MKPSVADYCSSRYWQSWWLSCPVGPKPQWILGWKASQYLSSSKVKVTLDGYPGLRRQRLYMWVESQVIFQGPLLRDLFRGSWSVGAFPCHCSALWTQGSLIWNNEKMPDWVSANLNHIIIIICYACRASPYVSIVYKEDQRNIVA